MKPIFKELIKFASEHNDLIRTPVSNSKWIDFFTQGYGLSVVEANIFILIFSFIIEREADILAADLREKFKLSFSEYIDFLAVIDKLQNKGMLVLSKHDSFEMNLKPTIAVDSNIFQKFVLGKDPLDVCKLDDPFSIVEYISNLLAKRNRDLFSTSKLFLEIDKVLKKTDKKLKNIRGLIRYNDDERAVLFIVADEFITNSHGFLQATTIAATVHENSSQRMQLATQIMSGDLEIVRDKYIILDDASAFMDNPMVKLTPLGAKVIFGINQFSKKDKFKPGMSTHLKYKNLKKELFFNSEFSQQLQQLKSALQPKQYRRLRKELKNSGYNGGFVSLFYGPAGAGKTASVHDMAYYSRRDILQVDIEKIRDKYVGESEKKLSYIFEEYKKAKAMLKRTPILLFNEADALISQRIDVSNSVDQMNNSMQNILLQNLENFEGIFVATTNLIDNIDNAFSRRFLFKLEFPKPDKKVREKIWRRKLPGLAEDYYILLSNYALSGGQIELIAKQYIINNFLNKKVQPIDALLKIVSRELSFKKSGKPMGFLQ